MKPLLALSTLPLLFLALTGRASAQNCALKPGITIALKADTGKYLARCNGCQKSTNDSFPDTITIHATSPSGSALFNVSDAGGGKIALKADNGKYLSRCHTCIVGGTMPEFLTAHVTNLSISPFAKFTPVQLANGKCALKADIGLYVSRCQTCSPGATVTDQTTIHVTNPESAPFAQFEVVVIGAAQAWEQRPTPDNQALDVGIGGNGTVWLVGGKSVPGGNEIFKWNGSGWARIPGGGWRIAVDPQGEPWILNSEKKIYRGSKGTWSQMPGSANDIGIGADGSVWVVGTDSAPEGYALYKWNGQSWTKMPGGGMRVAVDPEGYPWVIDIDGKVRRNFRGRWIELPGKGIDIGIGADGSGWYLDATNKTSQGFNVARLDPNGWVASPGASGVSIAVQPNGVPWITTLNSEVFQNTAPPLRTAKKGPYYFKEEAVLHFCQTSDWCDGARTCSTTGYCQGTARPGDDPSKGVLIKTKDYRYSEASDGKCTIDDECDGLRTCNGRCAASSGSKAWRCCVGTAR